MGFRTEHDSMGEMLVVENACWGAQTQRSLENFPIGTEKMPEEIIRAFAVLKKAAARANRELVPGKMTEEKLSAIEKVTDMIYAGELKDQFPLSVWQTGSGTQTNMNLNEVIANRGNFLAGKALLHPNDDVNMSQSSNDTFPSALHIAACLAVKDGVIPAAERLMKTFEKLEKENEGIVKTGRTHLMDAVPITFSQEISGWKEMLAKSLEDLKAVIPGLSELALGGTAVGTGLNAPEGFDVLSAKHVSDITGTPFVTEKNKFHALSSRDAVVFAHGALKALAADLMKTANDIRWLASGPRCGLGEITIPENEPGSSIMPGKVNPTQCEAVCMAAVQVFGNDAAVGFAASQGNFELNVYLPVIAYNFLQSARILTDAMDSFNERCVSGIKPNVKKMEENLERTLMTVTALSPYIGYDRAAEVAHLAFEEDISLRDAVLRLGYMKAEDFDDIYHPEKMI